VVNDFQREFSQALADEDHAVMIWDGAVFVCPRLLR
jgi:hypothetical protein